MEEINISSQGDLLAITRFKNALLYETIMGRYGSVSRFRRAFPYKGMPGESVIGKFINLRKTPINIKGEYNNSAEMIANILRIPPEVLFPFRLYELGARLPRKVMQKFPSSAILSIMEAQEAKLLPVIRSPEEILEGEANKKLIGHLLKTLTPNEEKVVRLRFGFDGNETPLERSFH